jgi:hypothetical protein
VISPGLAAYLSGQLHRLNGVLGIHVPKQCVLFNKHLKKYDIEFSDDPGVRIRQEPFTVTIWQGREAIPKVWQDIEATFNDGNGGEVLLSSLDDTIWEKLYKKELLEMLARRRKLKIETHALVGAARDNRGLPPQNCRLVPKVIVTADAPYYVYQDKVAIMKARDPMRIILIKNPTLAESFRTQFLYHWNNGKKI